MYAYAGGDPVNGQDPGGNQESCNFGYCAPQTLSDWFIQAIGGGPVPTAQRNAYMVSPVGPSNDPTGVNLFFEWVTGTRPEHRSFRDGDKFTESLRHSKGMDSVRENVVKILDGEVPHDGVVLAGVRGDFGVSGYISDRTISGRFAGSIRASSVRIEGATITYTIENESGTKSFFAGSLNQRIYERLYVPNIPRDGGASWQWLLSSISQTVTISEPVDSLADFKNESK